MDAEAAQIIVKGLFAQTQRYFQHEIAKRDQQIAELCALASREPDLDAIAQRAAVLIPKAKDGRDGKDGTNGKDGVDGKSIALADLEPVIAKEVTKAVAAIPAPRDGKDGRDGRDGDSVPLETIVKLIAADVAKAVSELPKPKDGKDGEPATVDLIELAAVIRNDPDCVETLRGERGESGERGEPGKQGDRGDKGEPGREGEPGKQGERGAIGEPGKEGPKGDRGEQGPAVTPEQIREAAEARFAVWALEFERAAQDKFDRAINAIPLPRDGRDGANGRDGYGLDDFEFGADLQPDGRTVEFVIRAGERQVSRAIKFAWPIDRGAWPSGGMKADKGDGVTFGGNFWIAQRDTTAKPGESSDWRLAVRRGKDGKDAE